MVQDTSCSQELYLASRTGGRCGGWGLVDDAQHVGDDMDYSQLRECTVIWAVSVPGESTWCAEEIDGSDNGSARLCLLDILSCQD
jgi:hypothetical protein